FSALLIVSLISLSDISWLNVAIALSSAVVQCPPLKASDAATVSAALCCTFFGQGMIVMIALLARDDACLSARHAVPAPKTPPRCISQAFAAAVRRRHGMRAQVAGCGGRLMRGAGACRVR